MEKIALNKLDPFPHAREPHGQRKIVVVKTELDEDLRVRFDVLRIGFYPETTESGFTIDTFSSLVRGNWLCGYVTFADGMPDCDCDCDELEVYGGVTYQKTNKDGSVTIGFDTNHCEQWDCLDDPDWVLAEAKKLYDEVQKSLEKL